MLPCRSSSSLRHDTTTTPYPGEHVGGSGFSDADWPSEPAFRTATGGVRLAMPTWAAAPATKARGPTWNRCWPNASIRRWKPEAEVEQQADQATVLQYPDQIVTCRAARGRCRPPRLATAESVARGRAAPVRGRLCCQAGQPRLPTSIRSVCTWWFRVSERDTVGSSGPLEARGSAVTRKAETIGSGGDGAPSSAGSSKGWPQPPRNLGTGSRNGRFQYRNRVRLESPTLVGADG